MMSPNRATAASSDGSHSNPAEATIPITPSTTLNQPIPLPYFVLLTIAAPRQATPIVARMSPTTNRASNTP